MRNHYDGTWVGGFEVPEASGAGGYRLRRVSDGRVLPGEFPHHEVIRRDHSTSHRRPAGGPGTERQPHRNARQPLLPRSTRTHLCDAVVP